MNNYGLALILASIWAVFILALLEAAHPVKPKRSGGGSP